MSAEYSDDKWAFPHPINLIAQLLFVLVATVFVAVFAWSQLLGDHPLTVPDFAAYSPNVGTKSSQSVSLPSGQIIRSADEAEELFAATDGGEIRIGEVSTRHPLFGLTGPAELLVCPEGGRPCDPSNARAIRFALCEIHDQDGRQWDMIFAPGRCRVPTGANPLKFVYRITGGWGDSGLVWGPILPSESEDLAVNVIADVNGDESSPDIAAELSKHNPEKGVRWAAEREVQVSQDDLQDKVKIEAGIPGLKYERITATGWILVVLATVGILMYGIGSTPLRTHRRVIVLTGKMIWPFRAGNETAAIVVLVFLVTFALAPAHAGEQFFSAAAQVIALLLLTLGVERRSFGLGDLKPLGPRRNRLTDDLAQLEIAAEQGLAWRPVLSVVAILMLVVGLLVSLAALAGEHPQHADARIVFGAVAGGTTAVALLAIRSPRSG